MNVYTQHNYFEVKEMDLVACSQVAAPDFSAVEPLYVLVSLAPFDRFRFDSPCGCGNTLEIIAT